jgi:hypothetical protein
MPGVGIELDADRVATARARGLDVHQGNILELVPDAFPLVEYVYLDNVLEHLPSIADIEVALGVATRIASKLVLIRHPSFEDVEYLADLGLKIHWTDWPFAHTAPARLHELVAMANRQGVYRIVVRPLGRITDSSHTVVLPSSARFGQRRVQPGVATVYVEERHGPKPFVPFDRPVHEAFEILLITGVGTPEIGEDRLGGDHPEIAWTPMPGHAPISWGERLARGATDPPRVVELPDGGVVVIEDGAARPVATPLVGRAIVQMFGSEPISAAAARAIPAGPPVTALKVPGEPAFAVIGGRRHDLPGIPQTLVVDRELRDRFEAGPPLDLLRAAASLQEDRRAARA